MMRTSWMVIGMALATCQCESGPTPARSVERPAAQLPQPPPAELRDHMRMHFEAATELQRAVADGRLADARELAGWFATHAMAEPAGWQPYLDEMRFAARTIEAAHDVATAGGQIGRLGRACSSCHEAQRANVATVSTPAPSPGVEGQAEMASHQWAAARLWEGVIAPSDQRWLEGARVLATTRIDVAPMAHEKPNAEVAELAERLRYLGQRASEVRDHDARAVFYGDMMSTCASCHTIVRPRPVVSQQRE